VPKNAQHLTDTTPTLTWLSAAYGALYEVEVDEIGGDFSTLVFTYTGPLLSKTTTVLAAGNYQWRARAYIGTVWSVWTPVWTFTITPGPPPADHSTNYADSARPCRLVDDVPNGVRYQIPIDNNSTPPARQDKPNRGAHDDRGAYYWRSRRVSRQSGSSRSSSWPPGCRSASGRDNRHTADLSWKPRRSQLPDSD
jgi:hypothetical protein